MCCPLTAVTMDGGMSPGFRMKGLLLAAGLAISALFVPAGAAYGPAAATAGAAMPGLYKNCTALNKKFPHGLGRANATDRTTGKGLDRDKDGIACENA